MSLDNLDNQSNDGCYDICTTLAIEIQSLNVLLLHFTPNDKKSPESKAKLSRLLRAVERFTGLDYPSIDAAKLKQDSLTIKKNFKDFLNRPSESYRDNLTRLLDDLSKTVKDVMNQISPSLNKKPNPRLERSRSTDSSANCHASNKSTLVASGVIKLDQQLANRDMHAIDFAFKYAKKWAIYCKEVVNLLERRAHHENELAHSMMKQVQLFKNTVSPLNGVLLHSELLEWTQQLSQHYRIIELSNTKRCRELMEVLSRQYVEFENISRHLKERWRSKVKTLTELDTMVHRQKSTYHQRCHDLIRLRKELSQCSHQASTESTSSSVHNIMNIQHPAAEIEVDTDHNCQQKVSDHSTSAKVTTCKSRSNTSTCSSSSLASSNVTDTFLTTVTTSTNQNKSAGSSLVTPPLSNASTPSAGIKSNRLTRLEKLDKQIQEAEKKEQEALNSYKEVIDKANLRLAELDRTKTEILCDIRLHTKKSDEVFKDSLSEYFAIYSQIRRPILGTTETLSQNFQEFVPCSEYQKVIDSHIDSMSTLPVERFSVEVYTEHTVNPNNNTTSNSSSSNFPATNNQNQNLSTSMKERSEHNAWTKSSRDGPIPSHSRTDNSIASRIRPRSSSRPRPKSTLEKRLTLDVANWRGESKPSSSYNLDEQCTNLRLTEVTSIVQWCIWFIEIHSEGLNTHGIYRVPVSKTRVSGLMEKLRGSTKAQDLSEETPLTLASVLKKTLINMADPLLTYSLYDKFIEIGKLMETTVTAENKHQLTETVNSLPDGNKRLASLLFHHLKRVADKQEKNQMNSVNLATLFGPTLLRSQPVKGNNIQELTDNSAQIRIVQSLIDHAFNYFPQKERVTHEEHLHSFSSMPCSPDDKDSIFGSDKDATSSHEVDTKKVNEDRRLTHNSDSIRRRTRSVILDYSSGNAPDNSDNMVFNLGEYKYIDADSDFYDYNRSITKSMPSLWPDLFSAVQTSSFTGTSSNSDAQLCGHYTPNCDKSSPCTEHSFHFSDPATNPISNKHNTKDTNADSISSIDLKSASESPSSRSRGGLSRADTVDVYFEEDEVDGDVVECRERASISDPMVLSASHYLLMSPRALPVNSDFDISGSVNQCSSNNTLNSNIAAYSQEKEEDVFQMAPDSSTAENSELMTKQYLASVSNTMSFSDFHQESLPSSQSKIRLSRSRSQFEDEPISLQSFSKHTPGHTDAQVATPSSPNLSSNRFISQSEACELSGKHKTLPRLRQKLKIFPLSGGTSHRTSAMSSPPIVARMSSSRYSVPDSDGPTYELMRHYSANSTPPPHMQDCGMAELASTPESVDNDEQSKRVRAPRLRYSLHTERNSSNPSLDVHRNNSDKGRRFLFRGLKPKSKNPEFV